MECRINPKWFPLLIILTLIFNLTSHAAPAKLKKDASGSRTFTFVNNCSYPVWFGMAGGSAQSKLQNQGTTCNSNSDCYDGSSCVQTGNIKQCFWNNPQPGNGNYQLAANGGTNQITIPFFSASPIVWSGIAAGRTNCSGSGCQTADCGNGTGSCIPGQSFGQTSHFQAEFTLSGSSVDFYDVEIINGVNIPLSMSPSISADQQKTLGASNPYNCGSPGAVSPSSSLLGTCSWQFSPPSNDYRWVQNGGNACSADSDCQSPNVCGISFNPGNNPLLKKTCGSLIGYWTANQICGIQRDYGAPFNCAQPLPPPQNNLTLWNLQACVGMGSCYQDNAGADCCGCVNWDQIGLTVPAAPYTKQCVNSNITWTNDVQPTLAWLKKACPTVYTYPFDDMSSTFTCSIPQNNVNTVNYTITFCPGGQVTPPTPSQQYSYTVYVGANSSGQFNPVVINNSITCPDPITHNPACLVKNQAAGSSISIAGTSGHACALKVGTSGNLTPCSNQASICNSIGTVPASATTPGTIGLPGGF